MTKWLVTGAAGFIGSNLTRLLLREGHEVIGVDNFSNGDPLNLKGIEGSFAFIEGDIRDFSLCQQLCDSVDCVSHQAAMGSVPKSIDFPLESHENNVTGFLNMILAAKNAGVRFVYASSGSVYGDNEETEKSEWMEGRALSPYAVTKKIDELYAEIFKEVYDFDSVGLRYFNVYGPRQKCTGAYANVIPIWTNSLLKGEPVYINGDGAITRDFVFVEDVGKANLMAGSTKTPGALVVNVGTGKSTTLNHLFGILKKQINSKETPSYRPFREGDALKSVASISAAKKYLNYTPGYTLREGLHKTVEWYREWNEAKAKCRDLNREEGL